MPRHFRAYFSLCIALVFIPKSFPTYIWSEKKPGGGMDGKLAYMHCVFRSLCTKWSAQLIIFFARISIVCLYSCPGSIAHFVSLYRFGLNPTECIYAGVYFGTRIIPLEQNLNSQKDVFA